MEGASINTDEYGAHFYMEPGAVGDTKWLEKEQQYVNHTGTPRLIHPHKYIEPCGDLVHLRLTPNEPPVKVLVPPS